MFVRIVIMKLKWMMCFRGALITFIIVGRMRMDGAVGYLMLIIVNMGNMILMRFVGD